MTSYLGLTVNSTPQLEKAVSEAIKEKVGEIMDDEPMEEIIS